MNDAAGPTKYSLAPFLDHFDGPSSIRDQILDLFLEVAPIRLALLSRAWDDRDLTLVAQTSHSLANIVGTLRCSEALEIARTIQRKIREGESLSLESDISNLDAAIREMHAVIAEHRRAYSG